MQKIKLDDAYFGSMTHHGTNNLTNQACKY